MRQVLSFLNTLILRTSIAIKHYAFAESTKPTWTEFRKIFYNSDGKSGENSMKAYNNLLLFVVGPLAAISIVVSGILWVIPSTDQNTKKIAKNIFVCTCSGVMLFCLLELLVFHSWNFD